MKKDTTIVGAGRSPEKFGGAVNPPVYRTSTVVASTLAEWEERTADRYNNFLYGRFGTPTSAAFEEAVARLEGADRAVSVASGLAACTATVAANVNSGGHILVTDNVYPPVRAFCTQFLAEYGVETEFYDPRIGADIERRVRPETQLIYLESPGSQTFEIQDVPAIVEVARAKGVRTAIDNTWATPVFFKPLDFGVDYSINAATKYYVGHSDAMLGVVSTRAELFDDVKKTANFFGACPGSEEVYLGLRGFRTLGVRLERHFKNALVLAEWFEAHPLVERVLYPALSSHPDHALWKRDFEGASGLFTVVFKPMERKQVAAFVDGLEYFGLGASFGGYESLVLPVDPSRFRTATAWQTDGPAIRFHIGLEDTEDLIDDLDKGLARAKKSG